MGVENVTAMVNLIQRERFVRVIDGYAGRPAGFLSEGGYNYLIGKGPAIIEPKEGTWETLRQVFQAIIGDDSEVGDRQFIVFLLWLQVGYRALVAGRHAHPM